MSKPRRGPKPKGPTKKSSVLSLRLEPSLRAALKKAAGSRRSLSEEIHNRLKISITTQREQDPFLRGLFYVFSQAALMNPKPGHVSTDRYKFEVFRSAVIGLLERCAPQGPVEPPDVSAFPELATAQPELAGVLKSPAAAGALAAATVWGLLTDRRLENSAAELPVGTWAYAFPQR